MSLSLKVEFPHLNGAIKVLRFNADIPIQQVLKEIKEKINFEGQDHGLFQPESTGKNTARWLKENHTLKFYNLPNEAVVAFKKKHRPLKVQLVDGSVKTVIIDDTQSVGKIRDMIGRKLGMAGAEEFSLKQITAKQGVWLKADADLYSQGVKEDETLIFDKAFFVFDETLDRSDPVQLHLTYVKAVQSIVGGTYPVTYGEAVNLAAIQAQASQGDFRVDKHKSGCLNLAEYVPAQWLQSKVRKPKEVEQEIFDDWKKLINMDDINAKYRYIQTVRQLPTYGVTFYTVKEPDPKKKGKNVQLLVGITREKILKMNYETKEVIQEFQLVHLKRWAAVQGKFTFDFGDHQGDYWTVQTDEAEAISNLIASYIDIIIMMRKQGVKQIEIDQRTGIATEEETADAQIAGSSFFAHNTPSFGTVGTATPQFGQFASGPQGHVPRISDVGSIVQMGDRIKAEFKATRGRVGSVSQLPRAQLVSQLEQIEGGLTADIDQLVEMYSQPSNLSKPHLERVAGSIAEKFAKFSTASQGFATNDPLFADASTNYIDAVQNLLSTSQRINENPYDVKLQADLSASKQVYDDAVLFMKAAQEGELNDDAAVNLITSKATGVKDSVNDLVDSAITAVKEIPGQNTQQHLIVNNYIKQLVPAAEALVHSATTLAPAIRNGPARQHIIDGAKFLGGLTTGMMGVVTSAGVSPNHIQSVAAATRKVDANIKSLIASLDTGDVRALGVDIEPVQVTFSSALRSLREAGNNQKKMLDSVKGVVTAANEMNRLVVGAGKVLSPDMKTGIENQVAQTKTHMNELTSAGKVAIQYPDDAEARHRLMEVAQKVEDDMQALLADFNGATSQVTVRKAGKQLVATAGALVGHALRHVPPSDPISRQAFGTDEALQRLLENLRQTQTNPEEFKTNARAAAAATAQLIAQIKRAKLSPEAEQKSTALTASTQQALQKLMAVLERAETQGVDNSGSDVTGALKDLDANDAQIDAAEFNSKSGFLTGFGGQSREGAVELLQQLAENLIPQCDNLVRTARGAGPLGEVSGAVAEAARDMITAVEAVASAVPDRDAQLAIIKGAKQLNGNLTRLVKAGKAVRADKGNPQADEALKISRSEVTKSLADLLNASKGVDSRDADAAIIQLKAELGNIKPVPSKGDIKQAEQVLSQRTKALNAAAQQLANMVKTNPRRVGPASKIVTTTAKQLVGASNTLAGCTKDEKLKNTVINVTKTVIMDLTDLIEASKTGVATGQLEDLLRAADKVGASTSMLESNAVGSAFPDIDEAVVQLMSELDKLDKPIGKGQGRRAVVDNIEQSMSTMNEDVQRLFSAAEIGTDKVGVYAKVTANGVAQVLTAAAAAKLPIEKTVTVKMDPLAQTIVTACQEIIDEPSNTGKTGPAVVQVHKAVQELANKARDVAASLANDKERQATYFNASKSLVAAVPKLVAAIKGGKPEVASAAASFLQKAIYKQEGARLDVDPKILSEGADTPVPPAIQEKLVSSARALGTAATVYLQASAQLAADPTNHLLAEQAQSSMQRVVESMNDVNAVTRELDPAKQEIAATVSEIQKGISDLDTATVNAGVGLLEKPSNKAYGTLQKELVDSLNAFAVDIRTLQERSGTTGETLMQAAQRVKQRIPEFVSLSRDAAAASPTPNNAKKLLLQAKNFGNNLLGLVNQCYTDGDKAPEFAKNASDSIGELLGQLKAADDILKELDDLVEKIKRLADSLNQPSQPSGRAYTDIKDAVIQSTRAVTSAAAALKSCDFTRVGGVALESKNLARTLPPLISLIKDAIITTTESGTKSRMTTSIATLIESIAELVTLAKNVSKDGDTLVARAEFSGGFDSFTQAIIDLLDSVKRGALGESKIDDGADALTRILTKLNTCAIFASAGQDLEGVKKVDLPFDKQVAQIVAAAEQLKIDADGFKESGNMSQDELGSSVEKFTNSVVILSEQALSASEKAPSSEMTQSIINAGKAVAISAKQVILSSKDVQRNPADKTGKAIQDSAISSFPRAIATFVAVAKGQTGMGVGGGGGVNQIDNVKREVAQSMANVEAVTSATAVSIVDAARAVGNSAAPIVFASNQDELIDGANRALRTIEDLLAHVKGAAASNPTVGTELSENAMKVVNQMTNLLDVAQKRGPNSEAQTAAASQSLTDSLENLVKTVNKMPGGKDLKLTSSVDLEATTNKELAAAAELIRNALKSLPKRGLPANSSGNSSGGGSSVPAIRIEDIISEESLNDAIVIVARSIAESTGKLVSASMQAQAERSKNAQAKARYHKDPTWANGLVSAAQKAAGGVNRLITCANNCVGGKVEEEQLVADARYVASCVKQLMVAAKVKEDINAQLQAVIQNASKDVAKSTSEIVAVAQKAGDFKEQQNQARRRRDSKMIGKMAGSIVAKIEQQTAILRLEKQLEDARKGLLQMNAADYKS